MQLWRHPKCLHEDISGPFVSLLILALELGGTVPLIGQSGITLLKFYTLHNLSVRDWASRALTSLFWRYVEYSIIVKKRETFIDFIKHLNYHQGHIRQIRDIRKNLKKNLDQTCIIQNGFQPSNWLLQHSMCNVT